MLLAIYCLVVIVHDLFLFLSKKFIPPPPVITGATPICSGSSQTFSATNWQSGYSWNKSSNLNISGSGSSVSVTGNGLGAGWVSINNGGQELAKKEVWVGPPTLTGISGGLNVTPNNGYYLYTAQFNAASSPTSFQFSVTSNSGGGYYLLHDDNDPNWRHTANIIFYDNGQYMVYSKACNACGWGSLYYIYVQSGRGATAAFAFPNPADNVLFVDLDIFAQANPSQFIGVPTYDVRLYDGSGNVALQQKANGGLLQFDVSGLPDGFYYLNIYDGSNANPVTKTIIVRH